MKIWARGAVSVHDLGAGWLVTHPDGAVLMDCGDGVAAAWRLSGLPAPDAIALSGGPDQEAGLFALLLALGRAGAGPLTLLHHYERDTPGALVGAWLRSGAAAMPVTFEAGFPPVDEPIGPFRLRWSREIEGALIWQVVIDGLRLDFAAAAPRWSPSLVRGADFALIPAGASAPAGVASRRVGEVLQ